MNTNHNENRNIRWIIERGQSTIGYCLLRPMWTGRNLRSSNRRQGSGILWVRNYCERHAIKSG